MAKDDVVRTPKFTIRRVAPADARSAPQPPPPVEPEPPAPEQQAAAEPEPPPPAEAPRRPTPATQTTVATDSTGGLFASPRAALAFIGAAFEARREAGEALVRRSPERAWWAQINASPERVAQLVFAAGGRPYARDGGAWLALSAAGTVSGLGGAAIDVSNWPIADLACLLAETSFHTGRYTGSPVLELLLPGAIGPWALRRAAALGLEAELTQALLHPLGSSGDQPSGCLRIRLQAAAGKAVPAAFVHGLTSLPYVAVCYPGEEETDRMGRLLVDVRCRIPLPPPLVQAMVPEGEAWVLAPIDVGHWRLSLEGTPVDMAALLETTTRVPPRSPAAEAPARLPDPIPVQLVAKPGLRRRVDAVLLDDFELASVRGFLVGRPVSEVAFLLPGNQRHLLTAPGGLPEGLPFGVPLSWIGPGPLYVELGTDFSPPLPDAARQTRFGLEGDAVVALLREGAWRFDPGQLLPAWALWVGDAPPVIDGLSPDGKRLLQDIEGALRRFQFEGILPEPVQPLPISRKQRIRLVQSAQKAELYGNLVHAAELLEKAGLHGPAGRLYERAAAGELPPRQ